MLKVSLEHSDLKSISNHIQATNAVATLLATWAFGIAPPNLRTLANVSLVVIGVTIASFGEIKFDLRGFICMWLSWLTRIANI
jgi:hypothetical protein